MDTTPKSVIVRSGQVNSLVFDDQPKTTLIIHKYVSGTRNEPLTGAEFKVTNSRGEVIGIANGTYYTDRDGDIMITGLDPGLTVTVRETNVPDGYVLGRLRSGRNAAKYRDSARSDAGTNLLESAQ